MTCQYCTAKNDPEDQRCQRCGRRIHNEHERPSPARTPYSDSSLARSLSFDVQPQQEVPAKPSMGPQIVPPSISTPPLDRREPGFQASLFGPQEVGKKKAEAARPAGSRPHRPPVHKNAQQNLDFVGALPMGNHALKTSVEARIFCNASIAPTPLRVVAAIADGSVGLLGVGLYVATFRLMGEQLTWTNDMLLSYLAAAVVISLLYRILFSLGNGDTPGMKWAGLRLLDFDGRIPTRQQRFHRLAGGCIGVLAAGLGLLWAMFDEERLTWHDHMSQTFPTVRV